MKTFFSFLFLSFLILTEPGYCQQLFTNTNIEHAYHKGTRSPTGKPGSGYWENHADYTMQVSFDLPTQLLRGHETIAYENNSPDTLKELIFRLYPDLYKKGVYRQTHIEEKDLNNGVQIESLRIGDEKIRNFDDRPNAYRQNILLIVKPGRVILPHSKVNCEISWSYKVNTGSPVRTGMVDSTSYFIAYFFPRIAVYDDVDGWDTWSYNGSQEFYNDFGNFNVQINAPKKYVVWATGDRQNPGDNFSQSVLEKFKKAAVSEKVIHIIDSTDYQKDDVFKNNATGIWKFEAQNVTDFAFALSDHYLWDGSSVVVDSSTGRRSMAEAAYNPIHKDYFDVANQAHQTLFYTSYFYPAFPFPFNHETVFDGTDQMEYPMMVNDNPTRTHKDAVQLTTHEIFHSYFPFFMGTNETQYAWMDEGWATIGESVISPKMGEPEDEGIFSKTRFEQISGTDRQVPLITNTKDYGGAAYLANSYGKAGVCYYVLQDLLGDKLYFKALHQYMNDWHGKHPTPYDFFFSMNNGSGKDLNWFWKRWFFGWQYPDLAVKKVEKYGSNTKIVVANRGGLPVPVYLTIVSKNRKNLLLKYTAEVWKSGEGERSFIIPIPFSMVTEIQLGNEFIPDKYPQNNSWKPK